MDGTKQVVNSLELAQALLENGDALLSDAAHLLEGGRPARAAALSVIASEEFSKLYLCIIAITGEAEIPSATSMAWRGHRDKLETAKALELAFVDPEPDFDMARAKSEVESLLRLKTSCLYVDHEEGEIRRPNDFAGDVSALIASGWAKSGFLHGIFDRLTLEVISAMDEHRELTERLVEALIDEEDPESTARRLRSVAAASVLDDPDALELALSSALEEVTSLPQKQG